MVQSKYKRLSYNISEETTPSANGRWHHKVRYASIESMEKGDRANVYVVELLNHCGTHIDCPRHQIANGKRLVDFPIDQYIYENPIVVDVPVSDEQNVEPVHLEHSGDLLAQADLVLIRSGFSRFRSDLDRYTWKTPGVSAETAQYLVDHCPQLKAIGVDFLSLELLLDMSHDFAAHRIFLSRDILILEDLNLQDLDNENLKRVFAFPLFVEGIDSFPVTVAAELAH